MKRSKDYRLRYWYYKLAGGKWKSTGEKDQLKALEVVYAAQHQTGPAPVLADYAASFFLANCPHILRLREEGKSYGKLTASMHRTYLEKYILTDPIAQKRLDQIIRNDVIEFRQRIFALTGKPPTTNRILAVLKLILAEAAFRQLIQASPAALVGRRKQEKREKGILSAAEIKALLGAMKGKAQAAFTIAACCGMRRGEVLALHWQDIGFEKSIITVCHAWKGKELGLPKSGQPRTVALPDAAARALRDLGRQAAGLVFRNPLGNRLSHQWWHERFQEAAKAAGIDCRTRNVSPHSLRHSIHVLLRDAGVADEKLRASMGWSSEKVQAVYVHTSGDALARQRAIIDGLIG